MTLLQQPRWFGSLAKVVCVLAVALAGTQVLAQVGTPGIRGTKPCCEVQRMMRRIRNRNTIIPHIDRSTAAKPKRNPSGTVIYLRPGIGDIPNPVPSSNLLNRKKSKLGCRKLT